MVAGQFAVLQARPIRGLEVAGDMEAGRLAEIERLAALSGQPAADLGGAQPGRNARRPTPLTWDIIRRFMSGNGGFGRFYRDLGYRPSSQVCEEGFLELIGQRIYADPERLAQLFWGKSPLQYDLDAVLADNSLLDQAPMKLDPSKADGTFLLKLPGMLATMLRSWRISKRLRGTVRDHFENDALPPYLDYVRRKRGEDLAAWRRRRSAPNCGPAVFACWTSSARNRSSRASSGPWPSPTCGACSGNCWATPRADRLASALTTGLEGDTTVAQNQLLLPRRAGRGGDGGVPRILRPPHGRRNGIGRARYREDPRQLDSTLQALRRSDRSPQEIHQEHAQRRIEVEDVLPALLARWGGSSFLRAITASIRQTQRLLAYRESGKHYLMLGYELIRAAILELAGAGGCGREVFFLRLEELEQFEARRRNSLATAAQRQVRWQSLQRLDMPEVIDSADLQQLGLPRQYDSAAESKAKRWPPAPPPARPASSSTPATPATWPRTTSSSALPPIPVGRRCSSVPAGWSWSAAACCRTGRSWPATSAFPPWSARAPPSASRTAANSASTETAA